MPIWRPELRPRRTIIWLIHLETGLLTPGMLLPLLPAGVFSNVIVVLHSVQWFGGRKPRTFRIIEDGCGRSAGGRVEQVICPFSLAEHQPAPMQQVRFRQRPVLPHHLAVDRRGALAD